MSASDTDNAPLIATASQTVGPFFHFALTRDGATGAVQPVSGAARIELVIGVSDGQGQPVADAMVEIWQAGAAGAPCGFGRLPTGEDGTCTFSTTRPTTETAGPAGRQAPHINVCLFARGLLRQLHTRVYFAGDALENDAVLALVPEDRKGTLVATPVRDRTNRWVFNVRLQEPDETVFFDV